ncbi:hypothetical protein N2152v2_004243 [Parachlorella kessleri]
MTGHSVPSLPQMAPRVLSIQSHVVSGVVGNKAAIFPMQLLGLEVDPIFTVQFSNHTGFPLFKGSVMDGAQLWELIEGLEANQLIQYTHLLTGYIGTLSLLQNIVKVAEKLRQYNPELVFVCDPVMGDDGRLYVKPEMPAAFRDSLVPIATVMTPNQFEAELLTGLQIGSEEGAIEACRALQKRGPHTVIITSAALPGWEHYVTVIASTTVAQHAGQRYQQLRLRVPRVDAYFTGTGDLFTALLLAWMHQHPGDLKTALEKAVAGLQAVLADTVAHCGEAAKATVRTAEVSRARELRLVQNQRVLVAPKVLFEAEPIYPANGMGR